MIFARDGMIVPASSSKAWDSVTQIMAHMTNNEVPVHKADDDSSACNGKSGLVGASGIAVIPRTPGWRIIFFQSSFIVRVHYCEEMQLVHIS